MMQNLHSVASCILIVTHTGFIVYSQQHFVG